MAIRSLPIQELDKFGAARVTLNGLTHKAIEWFADEGGAVLGAIAYHQSDLAWSFVILGRDIYGKFRALDLATGLRDLGDARRLLVEKMAVVVATSAKLSSGSPTPAK